MLLQFVYKQGFLVKAKQKKCKGKEKRWAIFKETQKKIQNTKSKCKVECEKMVHKRNLWSGRGA